MGCGLLPLRAAHRQTPFPELTVRFLLQSDFALAQARGVKPRWSEDRFIHVRS